MLGYDAAGQLARVTRGGTDTLFRYDGGDLISQQTGGATTSYLPNPLGDGALTRTDTAGTQTYLTDAQDSTLALADTTALPTTYTYDPFGQSTSSSATDPNAVRYTGRPSTPDLPGGLQYNRARFYHPGLHRFISQDPLGLASGDTNRYAYGAGNPVDSTDPSGLVPVAPIVGCALGALIRDVVGGLSGAKHTFADYAKGAGWGCVDGATLAAGGPALRSARTAARGKSGARTGRAGRGSDDVSVPRRSRTCNCFPAGTPITTAAGTTPIEDIKVGDQVLAHNFTTGHDELRTVTAVFAKHADDLLTVTAAGHTFQVTPDHPFWTPDRGWVDAADLRPGDHLQRRDGTHLPITTITHTHQPTTVHNLTVEGHHNYYATPLNILTHNCAAGRGRKNVLDSGIMGEVHKLLADLKATTVCEALDLLLEEAKANSDKARRRRIETTQKGAGCRHSRSQ